MSDISLITLDGINIDIDKPEDKEKKHAGLQTMLSG